MKFKVKDEYITLQQILKACNILDSGGQVKAYLAENPVLVNGESENRRGKSSVLEMWWKLKASD